MNSTSKEQNAINRVGGFLTHFNGFGSLGYEFIHSYPHQPQRQHPAQAGEIRAIAGGGASPGGWSPTLGDGVPSRETPPPSAASTPGECSPLFTTSGKLNKYLSRAADGWHRKFVFARVHTRFVKAETLFKEHVQSG